MHARIRIVLIAAGPLVALAACATGGNRLVRECQVSMKIPGQYLYDSRLAAPVVRPGAAGTARGAALLNACIAREAELEGSAQTVSVWTAPGVAPVRGGSGGLEYARLRGERRHIYPAAPPRPAPVYTPPPAVVVVPQPSPTYTQRPECRPQARGVNQEPLYC
ncbi:hypothetical protein AB1M95_16910 [Sulfitobacter sp. LCG007]